MFHPSGDRQATRLAAPVDAGDPSAHAAPAAPRFLSEEDCRTVLARVQSLGLGAHTRVDLTSQWRGDLRWARNRMSVASDWRNATLALDGFQVETNGLDSESLTAAVRWTVQEKLFYPDDNDQFRPPDASWPPDVLTYPKSQIWSDRTYAQTPDEREVVAVQLIAGAEGAGMLSTGYLSVEARGTTLYTQDGRFLYAPQTLAQCSLTVRDPRGTGSGWAGASSYDWNRFDAAKLAEVALDKCLRSRNPVAIEPGRYTTILEPQATYDLMRQVVVNNFLERDDNERYHPGFCNGPFYENRLATYQLNGRKYTADYAVTKLGQRVFDERLTLGFDPVDPDLGVLPFELRFGEPHVPVTWVDHGVLTNLAYDREYALSRLHEAMGKPNPYAFRMQGSGTPVPIEEMIATTKRGLLVTRFWDVDVIDICSVLCRGLTRDGLWLIENGKISKAVKNLQFTESPMIAFNNIEQVGVPVPVFSPEYPAVVPPIKVRDFSFTALFDAV